MNSVKDTTTTNNQTMNVFIPFLKATTQVLEELTQEIFTKKNIYPFQGNITIGDIKVEIGVVGDIQTRVIFDFPQAFAKELTSTMMGVADDDEITEELIIEAAQELGNMISGNALGFLEEKNIHCDITPPSIYIIKEKDIEISNRASLGVIEFTSNIGEFNIYVVINESDSHEDNLIILSAFFDGSLISPLARFLFPKGIGVVGGNANNFLQKVAKFDPPILLINTNAISESELNGLLGQVSDPSKRSLILFGDKEFQINAPFDMVVHEKSVEDQYSLIEKLKELASSIKLKLYTSRKDFIINIPQELSRNNFFCVTTKTGEYEQIPIAQLSLAFLFIDITHHNDINFPEGKNLTNNISLKLNGVTVPIMKAQIGKTLQQGKIVQIILHHILETELHKITEFMYYLLSLE
jgi:chemotaxis protein CheX